MAALGFAPVITGGIVEQSSALEIVPPGTKVVPLSEQKDLVMTVQFDEAQIREITRRVEESIMRHMKQGRIYLER